MKIAANRERKWYMVSNCSHTTVKSYLWSRQLGDRDHYTYILFLYLLFSLFYLHFILLRWWNDHSHIYMSVSFFLVLMTCPTVEWILKYKEFCGIAGVPKCIFDRIKIAIASEKTEGFASISMKCHNLFTVSHFLRTFITISPTHHQTNVCVCARAYNNT